MTNENNVGGLVTSAFSWFLTATQVDEVLRYVQLVLSIIATIVSISISIWCWYKRAMEDGKIDSNEVKELKDITDSAKVEIEKKLEDNKEKEGNKNDQN